MSTTPALVRDGEVAVQLLVELQLTPVAMPVANLNVVAAPSAKPLPLIVTLVAPRFVGKSPFQEML